MRKKLLKCISVSIGIIMCINLTGCWDKRELNDLGIVLGVGVDKGKNIDEVEVAIQLIKPMESSNNNISASQDNNYINLTSKGITILDAMQDFNKNTSRRLFFPDNQVIIFGKDIAEEGIEKYIDFFLRNRETRLLVWVLIAGDTAKDIFYTEVDYEKIPARNIGEIINIQKEISNIPNVELKTFVARLMSKTAAPIVPIVEVKMVGKLNEIETRGLLWVLGEVKSGTTVIETKKSKDKVTLVTSRAKSKLTPKIIGDKVFIEVKIEEEGDLGEQYSSEDLTNPEMFLELQKAKEAAIKKEVKAAIAKAKELEADVFGFGDMVYKYYPKQWKNMEDNWDKLFKDLSVEVVVESKLRRNGRITKPVLSKE
jgi:spore germination protein KC/spore germination protein